MNFAAVILATSMLTLGDATKKSKACAMKNWPACALEPYEIPTNNFSVLATRVRPGVQENDEISVSLKVHRNHCPIPDMQNLMWYRLEAFLGGTNISIGRFIEPIQSRRLETYSCHSDSTLVFETCEPHPLDLPRQYSWTAPRFNITADDVICFRLTVLDPDNRTCRLTESCVPLLTPLDMVSSASGDGEASDTQQSRLQGSGAFGESVNLTEKCHQRWDCTGAKMRLFCGSDGNTYTSRCHIRRTECLTDTDISIDYAGQCVVHHSPVCRTQRDSLRQAFEGFQEHSYWLPTCDCDGLFKPKQCQRDRVNPSSLECWCSYSNSISEVAHTRRRIVDICTDPSKFEFSCSTL